MNILHLWITLLALVAGLAGFAAGELHAGGEAATSTARFRHYADRMTATFDLSPDRERAMRILLDRYERDLEDLKSRHLSSLEPELVRLGDTYRDLIRDKVLPEDRRIDFDVLATGDLPSEGH